MFLVKINRLVNQPINQSITFARAPVTGDHWCRTSNLIKSVDKNQ